MRRKWFLVQRSTLYEEMDSVVQAAPNPPGRHKNVSLERDGQLDITEQQWSSARKGAYLGRPWCCRRVKRYEKQGLRNVSARADRGDPALPLRILLGQRCAYSSLHLAGRVQEACTFNPASFSRRKKRLGSGSLNHRQGRFQCWWIGCYKIAIL